jgi:hypothetical protein
MEAAHAAFYRDLVAKTPEQAELPASDWENENLQ